MKFIEHCKECQVALGKPWDVVHRWLDEFAPRTFPDPFHRVYRHHKEGVAEVRMKWGEEAARAAEMHILSDFRSLGLCHIPDKDEVMEMLGYEVIHHPDGKDEIRPAGPNRQKKAD